MLCDVTLAQHGYVHGDAYSHHDIISRAVEARDTRDVVLHDHGTIINTLGMKSN